MSNVTLVVGDTVQNGKLVRIDELHSETCRDLTRRRNEKGPHTSLDFTTFASIDEARAEYDIDAEDMGWWFDDEVKVLPCVHN